MMKGEGQNLKMDIPRKRLLTCPGGALLTKGVAMGGKVGGA